MATATTTERDIFLSRQSYDYLVTNCRDWMDLRWSEYRKQWSLGGVRVFATGYKIENLRMQLPTPYGT